MCAAQADGRPGVTGAQVDLQLGSRPNNFMDNDAAIILSSDSQITQVQDATTLSDATGTLLTTAPIQSLFEEFSPLIPLGKHFGFIGATVFTYMREDSHAEALRAVLATFNEHGRKMVDELNEGFDCSRSFYSHRHLEYSGEDIPVEITDEHIQKLMDPNYQKRVMILARKAATAWGNAATIVRSKLIPLLPQLQRELDAFVDDYDLRHHILEEREQSVIPYFVQNWLWGAVEPVRWNKEEVELLPQDCSSGGKLLERLVGFLDRMEAHFLRLSQLELSKLAASSYSSLSSIRDLYATRVACLVILTRMDDMIMPIERAFWHKPRV
ncbi:hypothetical protein FRC17_007257 [Serendipita sp. 399]|nr:hypothetical protein FRC17_007257 [Serendipita sp. 399]